MKLRVVSIASIFILAGLATLPLISAGAPPKENANSASKANQEPAAKFNVLYEFKGGADGSEPLSDLTLDAAGNLYGTTSRGGTGTCGVEPCGTVFALMRTTSGWEEKVLYNFTGGADGGWPVGGVIFDTSGNLYGTASIGGPQDAGTVFQLTPTSHGGWKERTIYTFTWTGYPGPQTDLIFDPHGNIYGTTSSTVFRLTPNSDSTWAGTTLHTFQGPPDGQFVSSPVVLDPAGNLYGVTEGGGTGQCQGVASNIGCGTVYELTPQGQGNWQESILYSFTRGGGSPVDPSGALLFDRAGNLLGTSRVGGNGYGTIFELHSRQDGTWSQSASHRFYGTPDGRETPYQAVLPRLVPDGHDGYFGVSSQPPGSEGGGVVFNLQRNKNDWRLKVVYTFKDGYKGFSANTGLVRDSEGNLYGATQNGGILKTCQGNGCGMVYEVTP
jgi:uncharacterized repeat protein (TIGR03803 family)